MKTSYSRELTAVRTPSWLRAARMLLLPSLLGLCGQGALATTLPVEDETLGVWHYCLPLQRYGGGGAEHGRPMFAPTTVEFGQGRIAVIVPGSEKVAEFKGGSFNELTLPATESPCSLATDRQGTLYCLLQRLDHLGRKNGWRERWVVAWSDATGWTKALQVPFQDADRLEFDASNRLWALGPAPAVAVFTGGRWNAYRHSNDFRPDFAPMRLAQEDNKVTLFSYRRDDVGWQLSHPTGVLYYQDDKFVTAPQQDVTALRAGQRRKEDLLSDDNFERRTGYVCHADALNARRLRPVTVLRTGAYTLVSFDNEGLAWADTRALQNAPVLDERAEWERITDVCVPPALAPDGTLWLVRDNPQRLVRVGKEDSQEYPAGGLTADPESSVIEVDQLGRPWVQRRNLQSATACLTDGTLKLYDSFPQALLAECAAFQPGRVFPKYDRVVKTPGGTFCLLGDESFTICDAGGVHDFSVEQISPGHDERNPRPGRGYNALRQGAPRFDEAGNIYTAIDRQRFRYRRGQWKSVTLSAAREAKLQPPRPASEDGDVLGAYETRLWAPDGRERLFRRLHFYERTAAGELEPLDRGLNPLAFYPFWTGWHDSPGITWPLVDPMGRLWISPVGPYAQNRVWMIKRK